MSPNRILELKERLFEYVQRNGPILPSEASKEFRSTNIFISALLSELASNKRIKISKAKIGGSPVYYCKEQESKLPDMLRNSIGQKPREALDLLREKKVLRDRDCLPFERVALRELMDFAIPVKLTINDTEELFWKWYIIEDTLAKDLIGKQLEQLYPTKESETEPIIEKEIIKEPEIKKEEIKIKETKVPEIKEKPKSKKKFLQEVLVDKKEEPTDFEKTVSIFLKKKEIKVLEKKILGKKEINFTVQVPSTLGDLSYFVKARHKKSSNEGDLLLAFTEGQNMKLPTIFVSSGDITKKANEYMTKNLKGMSFLKIK
ncbi:hypothetical protein J4467_01415 [Candidatus Woesearchaeota archaeon]|nr:hypothetical protein [Candidatus Woesearchaeota archaeon]